METEIRGGTNSRNCDCTSRSVATFVLAAARAEQIESRGPATPHLRSSLFSTVVRNRRLSHRLFSLAKPKIKIILLVRLSPNLIGKTIFG